MPLRTRAGENANTLVFAKRVSWRAEGGARAHEHAEIGRHHLLNRLALALARLLVCSLCTP